MIYQYNSDLQIVAEYTTLKEAERITGIPEKTVSSSIVKGSFCRFQWYFSRHKEFVPWERLKSHKAGRKFTVMVTDEVWEEILRLAGQRNKQDIFRELLKNWIDIQNDKH